MVDVGRLLFSALALAAFAWPASAADRPYRVSALLWSPNIPCQVAMREGVEEAFRNINNKSARVPGAPRVALTVFQAGDGQEGIERQIRQMRQAIQDQADLIIVQPTDNAALVQPLREANEAGIPVVAFDQYISGGRLAAYVTSDNYQAGYLDGEYVASRFLGRRELRLVMVEYPHVSSTVERVDGFLDALNDYGKRYRIVGNFSAVEPVGGEAAGRAILERFPAPGSVDVVFTVNDGGGLAVYDRLAAAGRQEIFFASVDGDPRGVQQIAEGKKRGIVSAQFCGPMGEEAGKLAWAELRGQPHGRYLLVPTFPVTAETAGRYPGWRGPIPADFHKPWPSNQTVWRGALKAVGKQ